MTSSQTSNINKIDKPNLFVFPTQLFGHFETESAVTSKAYSIYFKQLHFMNNNGLDMYYTNVNTSKFIHPYSYILKVGFRAKQKSHLIHLYFIATNYL